MSCVFMFSWLTSRCSSGISLSRDPHVLQTVWTVCVRGGQVLQTAKHGFVKSSLPSDALWRNAATHLSGEIQSPAFYIYSQICSMLL